MTEIEKLIAIYDTQPLTLDQKERLLLKLIDEHKDNKVYIDQLERSTTDIINNK